MSDFNPLDHPHRRYNPLLAEWILVSPHRTKRPWQGQVEKLPPDTRPQHDPTCYLCPGNERAGGVHNPAYSETFVFTNDFAAMMEDTPLDGQVQDGLLRGEPVRGTSRVICFHPRHDLTLPQMALPDIRRVVNLWADQVAELGANYHWVQVFENKGSAMGASNPHPHGQIWASDFLPNYPRREDEAQRAYYAKHGTPMLLDYAVQEASADERIVVDNEHWMAVVPYWAVWPFETMLLPRAHVQRMTGLNDAQRDALADVLKRLTTRYDNLFETSFPYSMGWHGAPTGPALGHDQS
ncbi:MAG: UDP-glucose--hexose-1-phosphate uridylyltransferase, partial [Pleurocapsa minor GSE-CHR-MK-17-07R]|nr:UDP-glucose--hexose-1-phosphate uridylyltransferase [Pleurocapsa minor GSE-CHR-MK 17-07R]